MRPFGEGSFRAGENYGIKPSSNMYSRELNLVLSELLGIVVERLESTNEISNIFKDFDVNKFLENNISGAVIGGSVGLISYLRNFPKTQPVGIAAGAIAAVLDYLYKKKIIGDKSVQADERNELIETLKNNTGGFLEEQTNELKEINELLQRQPRGSDFMNIDNSSQSIDNGSVNLHNIKTKPYDDFFIPPRAKFA